MIEGRLKGAAFGFTDLEAAADRALIRAEDLHLRAPETREQSGHGSLGQLRGVAIAAEMTQDHALDFAREKLFDHRRGRRVRKMAVPRHDPLFHRPWPYLTGLEKFLIMIRLDDERVHFAQSFHEHLRGVPEVGDEAEAAASGVKGKADRLDRVVRYRKGLHRDIADREFRAGSEQPPVAMRAERTTADRLRGQRIAINRHVKLPAKHFQSADVISVLMSQKHAIELRRRHSAEREPHHELARAQAAIDEQPAMVGHDQRAISGAATAEHREAEHARYITSAFFLHKQKDTFRPRRILPQVEPCGWTRRGAPFPRMKLLLPVLIALSLLQPNALRADEASQKKAAESLLALMGMEKLLSQSVDQMLALQVQQNPSLAPYQAQMKTFLNKYMSWASLKDDMAKVYMAEFTEAELNDLIKFYQTPLGKKTVEKMPSLMAKGAEMGQKRMQEHLPELQAAIQAAGGTEKKTP